MHQFQHRHRLTRVPASRGRACAAAPTQSPCPPPAPSHCHCQSPPHPVSPAPARSHAPYCDEACAIRWSIGAIILVLQGAGSICAYTSALIFFLTGAQVAAAAVCAEAPPPSPAPRPFEGHRTCSTMLSFSNALESWTPHVVENSLLVRFWGNRPTSIGGSEACGSRSKHPAYAHVQVCTHTRLCMRALTGGQVSRECKTVAPVSPPAGKASLPAPSHRIRLHHCRTPTPTKPYLPSPCRFALQYRILVSSPTSRRIQRAI
jgi:hypothetical protein